MDKNVEKGFAMEELRDKSVEYYSKSLTLFKANTLIDSKYKSSLLEARLFAISLSKINEAIEDKEGTLIVNLWASDIKSLIPNNTGSFYTQLSNAAHSLTGRVVGISDPEKQIFHYMSVVNNAHYENGKLTLEFNKNLRPYFKDITTPYTQMNLLELLAFDSPFSFRLFEVIKSRCYTPKGMKELSAWKLDFNLSELKLMIGAVNSALESVQRILNDSKTPDWDRAVQASPERMYDNWGDFRKRVILPAVQEINDKTSYNVIFDPLRSGRGGKVNGITFYVRLKESIKNEETVAEEKPASPLSEEEIIDYIFELAPFKMKIREALTIADAASNDTEKIKTAFDVLNNSKGDIDNPVGFIISAIEKGFTVSEKYTSKKKNQFNEMIHTDYDFDEIEKRLLAQ